LSGRQQDRAAAVFFGGQAEAEHRRNRSREKGNEEEER
jgi:hypothetical protein